MPSMLGTTVGRLGKRMRRPGTCQPDPPLHVLAFNRFWRIAMEQDTRTPKGQSNQHARTLLRDSSTSPRGVMPGLSLRAGIATLAACAMALPAPARAELREAFVDPTITGQGILPLLELPGAKHRDLRHFTAIDTARANGFLYVHLPGSGGLPENSLTIVRHAASLGFHAVSLAYPNWPSVQELTSAGGDASAPGSVREERLFGHDVSPLVQVDVANSVTNRLVRLVEHLHDVHPDEGWDAYVGDDGPVWSWILVGGHSQGAGHAAYLAQEFRLAGVAMFGGPGDFVAGLGVADWVFRPLATPVGRLYGFVHLLDPNFNGFQVTQVVLGLGASGPLQDVDEVAAGSWTAQRLGSSRTDIPEENFHGAVVVDRHLPVNPDGSVGYQEAWTYMLSSRVFVDSFED